MCHGNPLQVVLLQPGAHSDGGPSPGHAGQLQLPAAGGGGAAQTTQTRCVLQHFTALDAGMLALVFQRNLSLSDALH